MAVNLGELWWRQFEEQRRRSEALRTAAPRRRRRRPRQRNGARPESAQASPVRTSENDPVYRGATVYGSAFASLPRRCPRPHCGGTIIDAGDGATCLLCGRGPDGKSGTSDGELDRWALSGLMAMPPGPVVSYRAGPADAMGISRHGQPRK